ncbi:MAG: choice-of-anchor J domain-containing protein [Crocinitomicaceae bacterium]
MSKAIILAFIFIASPFIQQAQTFLIQEDFSAGIPAGWQVVDTDGLTPHSSVSQFNDGWIWYTENTDSSVACTSYFQDTIAAASDYLILPQLSLQTITKLSWRARSVDASYPDGYHVLISTTDSSLSSFTDTLLTVEAEYFQWNGKSIFLDQQGYANQSVYVAFHHFSSDGFILELDDIWVGTSDFATTSHKDKQNDFLIYPNPVKDKLHLQTTTDNLVEIYDLSGRKVISDQGNQLDVSSLAPGKYVIRITSSTNVVVKSFIKE